MNFKLNMKSNLFIATVVGTLLSSCGGKPGSDNNPSNCTMALDDSSWSKAISPNYDVFPTNKLYYSVKASANNCSNILTDSKDIRVNLNLKSSINSVGSGDGLVFIAMISDVSDKPKYLAKDVSINFKSEILNKMIADSRDNSDWKPPFSKPNYFILTFMVPSLIENTFQHFPKGNVYIEKK